MGVDKNAIYKVHNGTDFDTINFQTVAEMIKMSGGNNLESIADLTYYVATTGSDTNDGLTSGTPFKTINYAISKIPALVRHKIDIYVADGDYPESVVLEGTGGHQSINIIGNVSLPTHVTIISFLDNNNANTSIKGFTATGILTVPYYCFAKIRPGYLNLSNSITANIKANSVGVYCSTGGLVVVSSTTISSKEKGFYATLGGKIISQNNSGSANVIVFSADTGGIISKAGTVPDGNDIDKASLGGRIFVGLAEPSLGANGYRCNDDGTIEQWGCLLNQTAGGTNYPQLPIAFPNAMTNIMAVYNTQDSSTNPTANAIYARPGTVGSLSQLKIRWADKDATTTDRNIYWRAFGY